jgi:hypothetical protein
MQDEIREGETARRESDPGQRPNLTVISTPDPFERYLWALHGPRVREDGTTGAVVRVIRGGRS